VLTWIAARGADPWFPSAHAREAGVPRESLDEPLTELRLAGLVRIETWVRGAGQGYVLTADGERVAKDPAALARLRPVERPRAVAEPPGAVPAAPPPQATELVEFRPPIVTPALVGANLIWFLVGLILAAQAGVPTSDYLRGRDPGILHRLGAVSGPTLLAGEWWRLLTSCFVHVGGLHLLGNLLALGMMGPLAELLWGRWRLMVMYVLAGFAGSCLAMALRPLDPESGGVVILAGASGAIWGVLGSLVAWLLLYRTQLPVELSADLVRRLGVVVLLNVGVSFLPGVSWEAHLGGGVVGFIAAGLLNSLRFGDRPRRLTAVVVLVVLPVLCATGLVAAIESGAAWNRLLSGKTKPAGATSAVDAYNQTIVPLLNLLAPEPVRHVEQQATIAVVRSVRKPPGNAARVRALVEQKRAVAADVVMKLAEPTGVETVDQKRAKARAFAEARRKSFDQLLALLDNPADPAALDAWVAGKAEATRLWAELGQK
jgi:membrane associated rhomboid family serine protease